MEDTGNQDLVSQRETTTGAVGGTARSIGESLASLRPSVYASLAGVLVGLGINLLTEALSNLFSERYHAPFVVVSALSGMLLVGAAVLCYSIVLKCEWIHEEAERKAEGAIVYPLARDQEEVKLRRKYFKAWKVYMMIGLVFLSMIILGVLGCWFRPSVSPSTPGGMQPTPIASQG